MRRLVMLCLLAGGVTVSATLAVVFQHSQIRSGAFTGDWAGELHIGPETLDLTLRAAPPPGQGRLTVPRFGWYDLRTRLSRSGPGLIVEASVYGDPVRLEFRLDGAGTWRGFGVEGPISLRRRPDSEVLRLEDFSFRNGEQRLSGTLILPPGDGPFAAVVWTHGSGQVTREDPIYRSLAFWVAEHGTAALIYDKRPLDSRSTMPLLAADAVAGVEALGAHPRIRSDRIGVGGISQGGWISPIAASLSDRVAFVVGLSAPGISPAEQNIFNQHNKVLNAGFSEEVALESTRILREVYKYLRTGEGRETVLSELRRASRQPWFESAYELPIWLSRGLPPAPWQHLDGLDFDPEPVWSAVRVPVVCVWGSRDDLVPAERSRTRIRQWLSASGHRDHVLEVLEGADHVLRIPERPPWTQGDFHSGTRAVLRFLEHLPGQDD